MPSAELASTLEHRSGLLGLAGNPDLKAVLEAEAAGEQDATLAVGVYLHRLRAAIAAMTVAMNGLDVLLFTGGVGEHSPAIRQRAAAALDFLGVSIDPRRNESASADTVISPAGTAVTTVVIEAREDLQIVGEVHALLAGRSDDLRATRPAP